MSTLSKTTSKTTRFTQMRGWVGRLVIRVTALIDPPLAADARPIEVQGAIIDDVEQRTEPIGSGRRVLPYNQVSVTILAPEHDQRAAFQAALAELQDAVGRRLREMRCNLPAAFSVSVRYLKRPPAEWASNQRFAVQYEVRGASGTSSGELAAPPSLHVTVVRGNATQPAYALTEQCVHIGRSAAPVDSAGRVRHNHIAFAEDEDEHSRSVGRAHASIHYQPERAAYQIFDDGSRNGTRVVRGGTTFDVICRDPVGITIQSGDEIQLGTAAIRVRIET